MHWQTQPGLCPFLTTAALQILPRPLVARSATRRQPDLVLMQVLSPLMDTLYATFSEPSFRVQEVVPSLFTMPTVTVFRILQCLMWSKSNCLTTALVILGRNCREMLEAEGGQFSNRRGAISRHRHTACGIGSSRQMCSCISRGSPSHCACCTFTGIQCACTYNRRPASAWCVCRACA